MESHEMHEMHMMAHNETFSTDVTGLAPATSTGIVDVADGETFDLVAAPVRKRIGDADVRMLAYNGSVPAHAPGPAGLDHDGQLHEPRPTSKHGALARPASR